MNELITSILLQIEQIESLCDHKLYSNAQLHARQNRQEVLEIKVARDELGDIGFDIILKLADILENDWFNMKPFDLLLLEEAKARLLANLFPSNDYYSPQDYYPQNQIINRLDIFFLLDQIDNFVAYISQNRLNPGLTTYFASRPKTMLEQDFDRLIQGVKIYNNRISLLIRSQEIEKTHNPMRQKIIIEHLPCDIINEIMNYLNPSELSILFYDVAIHCAFKLSLSQLKGITTKENTNSKVFLACNPFLFHKCTKLQEATNQLLQKGIPAKLLGYVSIKQYSLIPWVNINRIRGASNNDSLFKEFNTNVLFSNYLIMPYVCILSKNGQTDIYYWVDNCWRYGRTAEYSHKDLAIKMNEALARPAPIPELSEFSLGIG